VEQIKSMGREGKIWSFSRKSDGIHYKQPDFHYVHLLRRFSNCEDFQEICKRGDSEDEKGTNSSKSRRLLGAYCSNA
jgi:hypothetical protein